MSIWRLNLLIASSLVALCGTAHAQYVVVDPQQIAREAAEAGRNLSQLEQQFQQLKQSYQEAVQTYFAVAHTPNLANLTPSLNTSGILNPLGSVGQVPSIMSGSTFGGFSSAASQFMSQNQYYAPSGSDPQAQEMNRESQSTAGVEAMAYTNLQSTQERINEMPALREEIGAVNNEMDISAVNARIAADQDDVQTLSAQAQQLQLLQAAQIQVSQQRREQKDRQDADSLFNDTQALN